MPLKKSKGFTVIEIITVVSVITVLAAVLIYYYNDYVEDAKMTVRIANIKSVNEALQQYYKEHMSYPKYNWKLDNNEDLKNKINKGLDSALSKYFLNKSVSKMLHEAADSKEVDIYYRVTKPFKSNSANTGDLYNDKGVWKKAIELNGGIDDYFVNEIKVSNSDE